MNKSEQRREMLEAFACRGLSWGKALKLLVFICFCHLQQLLFLGFARLGRYDEVGEGGHTHHLAGARAIVNEAGAEQSWLSVRILVLVEAGITEWTMTFSQVEVTAVNGFQMCLVAIEEMALVIISSGDEARWDNQVGIEAADRACSHDVFVETAADAAVCAP